MERTTTGHLQNALLERRNDSGVAVGKLSTGYAFIARGKVTAVGGGTLLRDEWRPLFR